MDRLRDLSTMVQVEEERRKRERGEDTLPASVRTAVSDTQKRIRKAFQELPEGIRVRRRVPR